MSMLVVATRLHLGNATEPPSDSSLRLKLDAFERFCLDECGPTATPLVAVDATAKIPGYDLIATLLRLSSHTTLNILPVTPWGFTLALNALTAHALSTLQGSRILFVSAETAAPARAIQTLLTSLQDNNTLVAGARLPGHDYRGIHTSPTASNNSDTDSGFVEVELDGRTTPWNTMALWNLQKLSLTGFQLVSEGLFVTNVQDPSYAGVEEVVAICVLQKLLGRERAQAKLLQLDGVAWDQEFDDDPARQQWHQYKMESKVTRADRQLALMNLSGTVIHG